MKHTPEEIKNRLSNIGEAIGNIALDYITDLEKENERLTVSYETLKLHDEEEIGMLKSENAELKEINEGYCRSRDRLISIGFPNFKDCKEYAEHLTKAKEIIRDLINLTEPTSTEEVQHWNETFRKAEKFLSEVEKYDVLPARGREKNH